MESEIKKDKIKYLINHVNVLEKGMTDRIGNITLLNSVRNILVSQKPLMECAEYSSLNQYFEQHSKSENMEKSNIALLHVLSGMVSMMGKGHDNQVEKVTSYYTYLESFQTESSNQKVYKSVI